MSALKYVLQDKITFRLVSGVSNINTNSTNNILNNGDETDTGSVEDVEPSNVLGGRKKNGPTGIIPKGQADSMVGDAADKAANKVAEEKSKEPSLKIRIKLNLNVKLNLDAHIDGDIEIGLL